MGPRGFNGSQGAAGPQGAQGVGNISACTVKEKRNRNEITGDKELVKVVVSHDQHAVRRNFLLLLYSLFFIV